MPIDTVAPKKKGIFYGWYIVIGAFILNIWNGSVWIYGFTAFFNPIRTQFNWTYTQTSLAFSFQRLETGLAAPVIGFMVDRLGPRKLMLIGLPIIAIGNILLSTISDLGMFYAAFMVIAIGQSMGSFAITTVAVNNWFRRRRGLAFSIIAVGIGLSGIGVPLVVMLLDWGGWRTALLIIGIGWLVVGLPVASLMRQRPEQYGYLPDGDSPGDAAQPAKAAERVPIRQEYNFTWREAIRTRAFYFAGLIGSTQAVVMGAVFVHEIPYLESIGFATGTAAFILSAMTLSSLIGRVGLGALTDWVEPHFVYMMLFALEGVGLLAYSYMSPGNLFLIILFLSTFPIGYGASTPVRPSLLGNYFGRRSFGAIQGLQALITMWPGMVAPLFAGWMYDTVGSYQVAWLVFAVMAFASIPLAFLTTRPQLPAHARVKQAERVAQAVGGNAGGD
ncbi:MAG: MFS transporter [Chloroflexi bacterium]|nr:MFS transporter [Chloroflexota bacterium]MBI4216741.1 MFS transporter [Chloroflexota bacterium]